MKYSKFLILIIMVLFTGSIAFSQAVGTRGSVSGVVKNAETLEPLANATVKIFGDLLPAGREYVTTENGLFRFAGLLPGKYTLKVTHPDMMDLEMEVTVALDKETQVEAFMVAVGRVTEEITVTAVAPLVDVKSTEISTNIDSSTIRNLPLGRSYASLFHLAPGVADNRDFAPNAGGNRQDNVFLYDGSNITNPLFGYLGSNFSELDIQEVNIKRGAISAEFGRASGMVTNAVTKSGTNTLSGTFRFVAHYGDWQAKSKDPNITSKTDSWTPALGIGGPIIKDRVWFYASGNVPRSTVRNRRNNLGEVPDAKSRTNEFFVKLSANPHPKHLLIASFRNGDSYTDRAGVGVNDHPSTATDYDGANSIIYASWTWAISPTSYLEVKYDHVVEKNKSVPITDLGYLPTFDVTKLDRMGYFRTASGYIIGGATASGQYVGGASEYNTQNFYRDEVKLVFSKYLDFKGHTHNIKAGFGYEKGTEHLERLANGWGSIILTTYAGKPAFRARYYPQQPAQDSGGKTFSIFIQDTATIGERLTLYLGVLSNRDEYFSFGKNEFNFWISPGVYEKKKLYFNFDEEIQPRVGFTYVIDKKAGDKLYANYGRYYAMDNRSIARAASPQRIYRRDAYFDLTGKLLADTPQAAETGKVILSDIKPTYQDEYVIGYSRPLFGKKWVLDIWGQYRHVKNVIEDYPTKNRETAPSTYVYGNLDGKIKYDSTGYQIGFGALAKRIYKAFTIQLQKPFSDKWSLMAMYTWSRLSGNWDLDYAAGTALFYQSSYIEDGPGLYVMDPNRDGILIGDRTHVFKLFGAWEFFKRTTIGGYLRIQSGRPWEARGLDYFGNYYRYLEKAGSHRLDTWTNLDLQINHSIPFGRFTGIIEARVSNVFDTQTVLGIDMRQDQPTFKNPTSYAPPRSFTLTFYLNF